MNPYRWLLLADRPQSSDSLLFEELRKSLNSKNVVCSTARFPATMHGEYGIAHIDTSQRNRRSEDVS